MAASVVLDLTMYSRHPLEALGDRDFLGVVGIPIIEWR